MSRRPPLYAAYTNLALVLGIALGFGLGYLRYLTLPWLQQRFLGRYALTSVSRLVPDMAIFAPRHAPTPTVAQIEYRLLWERVYHASLLDLFLPTVLAAGVVLLILVLWGSTKDARRLEQWRKGIQTAGPELLTPEQSNRKTRKDWGRRGFTLFLERRK